MFSWSNQRRGSSAYPATRGSTVVAQTIHGTISPPVQTRQEHLKSYLNDATLKRSTRRVSPDDCTYDTVFQTTSGDTLILRVHVPVAAHIRAPCPHPTMTLVGVEATHPWLDHHYRVTGYPAIRSETTWRDSRVILGTAVREVVEKFQLNPPSVSRFTDETLRRIQSKPKEPSENQSQAASRPSQNGQVQRSSETEAPPDYDSLLSSPSVDMPLIPLQFNLDEMAKEELDAILNDEESLLTFVNTLPLMKELQSMRITLLEENAETAKQNLEKEGAYNTLREEVEELGKLYDEELEVFRKLEEKQNSMCVKPDTRTLLKKLNRGKKEALDESEDYAEEWIENGGSVDDFVKTFLQKRRIHHERAAKAERLRNQYT